MSLEQKKTWYSEWFNSPYYHILYSNHDDREAQLFIDNLLAKLGLPQGSDIADIACGRGRHSLYFSEKGYEVTGYDLSPNSVAYAQEFAHATLSFEVHDMREKINHVEYDLVVNLFTSFGYFDEEKDNYDAIATMAGACSADGHVVIDFMNTGKVLENLIAKEIKVEDDIVFKISRSVVDNFIVKNIQFADGGKKYSFEERVRIIYKEDFQKYFQSADLNLMEIYGNYGLEPYDPKHSDRMIFILRKS